MPDLRQGCMTGKFWGDTAPADALVDEFQSAMPLATRDTNEDVQEKFPRFTIFNV